jgi:hypothetical protein
MEGNWNWMLPVDKLNENLTKRIHDLLASSGRLPNEQ